MVEGLTKGLAVVEGVKLFPEILEPLLCYKVCHVEVCDLLKMYKFAFGSKKTYL